MELSFTYDSEDTLLGPRPFKGNRIDASLDDYVVVDTETTGVNPSADSIIEVSAIKVCNNQIADTFTSLIRIDRPLPDKITKLTGITDEMLAAAPDASIVIPEFLDFVGDLPLVAHNAHFDINFLYDASVTHGDHPLSNDFVDTLPLCRRAYPNLKDHKLTTITSYLQIQNDQAHRALNDATCTLRIYENLKSMFQKCNIFGACTPESITESIINIVGDDGSNIKCKKNKFSSSLYIFKSRAFVIVIDEQNQYLETSVEIAEPFVSIIPDAHRHKKSFRFPIECASNAAQDMKDMIHAVYDDCADHQTRGSMLACCNDFERCSDEGVCLHRYEADYAGCWYRKNLDKGKIFYGKNRNI